jgi:DNA-damage-inducible protein J
MTTVSIRIDPVIKAQATKTLTSLGISMSDALKLFLEQVIQKNKLPFPVRKRSPKEIRAEWDKAVEEALRNPGYNTAEELHRAILKK